MPIKIYVISWPLTRRIILSQNSLQISSHSVLSFRYAHVYQSLDRRVRLFRHVFKKYEHGVTKQQEQRKLRKYLLVFLSNNCRISTTKTQQLLSPKAYPAQSKSHVHIPILHPYIFPSFSDSIGFDRRFLSGRCRKWFIILSWFFSMHFLPSTGSSLISRCLTSTHINRFPI